MNRKEFIIGTFAAGLATGVIGRDVVRSFSAEDLPPSEVPAEGMYLDPLLIQKGVHIRTSPEIPERTRFDPNSNVIPWEKIYTINGTNLIGHGAFILENAEFVTGQPIMDDWGYQSRRWLKVLVSKIHTGEEKSAYIHDGPQASAFITNVKGDMLGHFIREGLLAPNNMLLTDETLLPKPTTETYVPNIDDRILREYMPSYFARLYTELTQNRTPLREGSNIKNVKVVASGDTWDERVAMEMAGTPVAVRTAPGKFYPNGEPIEVIGQLPQGTEIENVLFSRDLGWGAFKLSDIQGPLVNVDTNVVSRGIGFVWPLYLG